uniref:Uncharacterized protein n=1 Tax=viral metagenome TaxID=1070528 RepID=A0A6C0BF23_9ZZZZ
METKDTENLYNYFDDEKRKREEKNQKRIDEKLRIEEYKTLTNDGKLELYKKIFSHSIIDEMFERGYLPYFYNGSYGGPGLSKEAIFLMSFFQDYPVIKNGKLETKDLKNEKDLEVPFQALDINNEEIDNHLKKEIFLNLNKYQDYSIKDTIIYQKIKKAKVISFLGENANGEYSCPVFDFVKIEYHNFIIKNEYDGLETISFDFNKYVMKSVGDILKLDINSDDKILKIKEIYDNPVKDEIIDFDDSFKFIVS